MSDIDSDEEYDYDNWPTPQTTFPIKMKVDQYGHHDHSKFQCVASRQISGQLRKNSKENLTDRTTQQYAFQLDYTTPRESEDFTHFANKETSKVAQCEKRGKGFMIETQVQIQENFTLKAPI